MSSGSEAPSSPAARFELIVLEPEPGVRIAVRRYSPADGGRIPVVLSHGLLSSAEIFDVPGLPGMSLARSLACEGHPVYAFDQRCAGSSSGPTWDFGIRETALTDLPAVIRLAQDREGIPRVALVAHSLGGLCQYVLLAALSHPRRGNGSMEGALGGLEAGHIAGLVSVASPARFSQELEPWRTLIRHGDRFLEKIDPDGDGMVQLADFVQASLLLPPRMDRLLPSRVVRGAMALGSRSRSAAAVLKALPRRSFLYDQHDFDAPTFRKVLASKTLEPGSAALVSEILHAGLSGGSVPVRAGDLNLVLPEDLASVPPIPLLTVSSKADALVPEVDVAHAHAYLRGEHIITERELGATSGHAGYFFKEGLRHRLYVRLEAFLDALD